MIPCPMCGGAVPVALDNLIQLHKVTGQAEAILRAFWEGQGRTLSTERLFDAMYADDPDGGHGQTSMHAQLRAAVQELNILLAGRISIGQPQPRRGRWRLRITL
ncbi:hypothetical protein [Pseudogemmobacter sp. W21_MBD1_M6]|uniref:hypothetical protein n=1 Tax=Pseudogemmobacter sp. W21_MBD1_M6 TaxID=3240271 RepID=UPI003F9E03C2